MWKNFEISNFSPLICKGKIRKYENRSNLFFLTLIGCSFSRSFRIRTAKNTTLTHCTGKTVSKWFYESANFGISTENSLYRCEKWIIGCSFSRWFRIRAVEIECGDQCISKSEQNLPNNVLLNFGELYLVLFSVLVFSTARIRNQREKLHPIIHFSHLYKLFSVDIPKFADS